MNPAHLHILQHSLGCDQHGRPTPLGRRPNPDDEFECYRNRFITDPASPDGQNCQALVALGYMTATGPLNMFGGMTSYSVTEEGHQAMRQASPPPPKLSASKRRWQAFRAVSDLMNFRQYLCWDRRAHHEATFQV